MKGYVQMTMPVERARSLRLGWEFLWELQAALNLYPGQLAKVSAILRYYPCTNDIAAWAFGMPGMMYLRVEDHAEAGTELKAGVPTDVVRGDITPAQRLQAISDAAEFFGHDLRVCDNLTTAQRSNLASVMRHFPLARDIAGMARLDAQVRSRPAMPAA